MDTNALLELWKTHEIPACQTNVKERIGARWACPACEAVSLCGRGGARA
jgi:hypothetical protein